MTSSDSRQVGAAQYRFKFIQTLKFETRAHFGHPNALEMRFQSDCEVCMDALRAAYPPAPAEGTAVEACDHRQSFTYYGFEAVCDDCGAELVLTPKAALRAEGTAVEDPCSHEWGVRGDGTCMGCDESLTASPSDGEEARPPWMALLQDLGWEDEPDKETLEAVERFEMAIRAEGEQALAEAKDDLEEWQDAYLAASAAPREAEERIQRNLDLFKAAEASLRAQLQERDKALREIKYRALAYPDQSMAEGITAIATRALTPPTSDTT